MTQHSFHPDLDSDTRALASRLIDCVLKAADPYAACTKHLDQSMFMHPTHILAMGKASIPMTNAVIECMGNRFARATVISTPDQCAVYQFKDKFVDLIPGDHPLPTQRSVDAATLLNEHARSIPSDHQALALLSGGASAMVCSPAANVTVDQIISTTQSMLRDGRSIDEINEQRSSLETLKGGGLARVLDHVVQVRALVLSDVIGDRLSIIASGPLVDQTPPSIPHTIIANNATALDALIAGLTHEQIEVIQVNRDMTASASSCGRSLASQVMSNAADTQPPHPVAVSMGGEPTVDTGSSCGTGGPMLELAIACALELCDVDFRWTIFAFASDGIDGPTDTAGAIIDSDRLRQNTKKSDLKASLDQHDTLIMCDTLGASIRTGSTGTNVNDVAVVIRWPD